MTTRKQNFNYEEFAYKVIQEHNKVRTDPSSYIEKIQNLMKHFRGNVLYKPREDPVNTYEGKAAFDEAIEFLRKQHPVDALTPDDRLSLACKDHTNDIGPKGNASHESSDGKTVSDRIEKYCEWDGACSENIDLGTSCAEDLIINFIVDDGIPQRLQRRNLFSPELKFIGVAAGEHKEYKIGTVVNYVTGVRNLGETSPDVKNFITEYLKKAEERKKNPKPLNPFQEEDPDAPDDTVSVKIIKTTKLIQGKQKKITRKIYSLSDTTQHIVEIEDA